MELKKAIEKILNGIAIYILFLALFAGAFWFFLYTISEQMGKVTNGNF